LDLAFSSVITAIHQLVPDIVKRQDPAPAIRSRAAQLTTTDSVSRGVTFPLSKLVTSGF
jgi:hypothetical protein